MTKNLKQYEIIPTTNPWGVTTAFTFKIKNKTPEGHLYHAFTRLIYSPTGNFQIASIAQISVAANYPHVFKAMLTQCLTVINKTQLLLDYRSNQQLKIEKLLTQYGTIQFQNKYINATGHEMILTFFTFTHDSVNLNTNKK